MKPAVGTLVACLIGYVAAASAPGADSGLVARRWKLLNEARADVVARDELPSFMNKLDVSKSSDGFEFQERVHGNVADVNQFVNSLSLKTLKSILGEYWGHPFRITFLEQGSNNYLGYIAGYFTSDGGVSFDPKSVIPGGGNIPKIQKQPSLAPPVTTITLSGAQSAKIISAGKVTDKDLHNFLGADYGSPFKLILTSPTGGRVGFVSGSFSGSGPKFDADISIPKPSSISDSGSGSAGTGAGSGSGSTGSGSTGSGSTGSGSTGSGSTGSGSTGTGSSGSGVAEGAPAPTDAPSGSNTGSVTLDGASASEIKNQLNNLSYDYILKAVKGKYGPFYITFGTPDGSLQGYIKGTISKSNFNYEWSYTYQS